MKALTLTQPYAFLVADHAKFYETRSWRTNYRGPLAIHAAGTLNGVGGKSGLRDLLDDLPDHLAARIRFWHGQNGEKLDLGAVLAVSWLEDVELTSEAMRDQFDPDELAVGNYADGRFAWKLREPVRVAPVPIRGHLGLWNLDDALVPCYARNAIRHPGPA